MTSPPSGTQHVVSGSGYRAVVTQAGGTLRELTHDGRPLLDGFAEDEQCSGGRGQQLIPWPNRIRDGAYRFADRDRQLPLTEVPLGNASHGLVRWADWRGDSSEDGAAVTMRVRVSAQPGYPWSLDVATTYAVGPDGLVVTMRATNLADSAAPFACGAHPYLSCGSARIDDDRLRFGATTRMLTDDERLLPVGAEDVAGTSYDFAAERAIGDVVLNHAFSGLTRDADGRARVTLRSPAGHGVELWMDEAFGWVQLFSADGPGPDARRSLAVEPMTAPPDAFNSATDLVVLEPGATFSGAWGIRAVG